MIVVEPKDRAVERVGEIKGVVGETPHGRIRNPDPVENLVHRRIGIDAIKRAGVLREAVVHRARPEAALAVALAFVETVGRDMRLGLGDPFDLAAVEIVERQARGEGDDQSAGLP